MKYYFSKIPLSFKDSLPLPFPIKGAICYEHQAQVHPRKYLLALADAIPGNCTHMGCVVRWNSAEKSWDCPCHGSRFDVNGRVLHAPAVRGLAPKGPGETSKP